MEFENDRYSDQPLPKNTRPTRYIGAGIMLFGLALTLSLLSYNQQEMGWAVLNERTHEAAAEAPCSNWLSVPGLYLGGLAQLLLGGGALYASIMATVMGTCQMIKPEKLKSGQWISAGCMVLFACAFLDLQNWILNEWAYELELKGAGGYVGYVFGTCILAAMLGPVWAAVLVVVSHGIALVCFTRIKAKALATQAWKDTKAMLRATGRGLRFIWHKIRRKQKPTPHYLEDEEDEGDWKQNYDGKAPAPQPQPELKREPQQPAQQPRQPQPAQQQPRQQAPLPPRQMPRSSMMQEQPARREVEPQDSDYPEPTIQTAPPRLRMYQPPAPKQEPKQEPQPRRMRDPEARPLPFEEQMAEADKKLAAKPMVQAPPTGRARLPKKQQNSQDNYLDLLRSRDEEFGRRSANDNGHNDSGSTGQAPINQGVLNAMNRRLGKPEEKEEEEEDDVQSVPPPPQTPPRAQRTAQQTPPPAPAPAPRREPAPLPPRREPAPAPRTTTRELPKDTRVMQEDYPLPSYDLLNYIPVAEEDNEAAAEEMRETQQCIMDALETFKIKVAPGDITRGPSITRYEFYPPQGLRLNKITNLADNLKLAAQAKSINILAPVPGKNTIGIELENAVKAPVYLRELLQSEAFHSKKLRIPVALGKDVYGNPVIGDLAAMPHTLVAGTTGSGKSVCVNSMILSMLYKFRPDELRLILVDPKVVEMQPYKKLPHLACPVVTVASRVIGALRWAVNEMEHRYKLFSKMGVRNFEDFNNRPEDYVPEEEEEEVEQYQSLPANYDAADAIVRDIEDSQGIEDIAEEEQGEFDFDQDEEIPAKLPYIVIIIDELADLMMQVKEDLENYIARLTQKARAAGIHLVAATQTPRANVITGIIKANIPSRLAFKVASPLDSRVILDTNGAENLLGKGDFLFLPPGGITKMTRAQGAFVSDPEIAAIVKFCAAHAKQNFVQGVTAEMNNADSTSGGGDGGGRLGGNGMSDDDAELYTRCVQLVITERKASTSLLQRRFSIGYGRAAKIMDMMESRGVIGPASGNTSRPREVLIEAP